MEEKRSDMAGITILKIEDLRLDEIRFKKEHDDDFNHKQKNHIKRYGQYETPIVAEVDGVWRIVDGLGFVKNYAELGFDDIHCYVIPGGMSQVDFYTLRIFKNIKKTHLEHLTIAEIISMFFKTRMDFRRLAHKINISEDDIQKYAKLLEFDWDEFARTPIGNKDEQMTFFDMFEDNGEIF